MRITQCILLAGLLGLVGCAHSPSPDSASPASEPEAPAMPQGITFSVSGEPQGEGECFVRYEIGYPEDIEPVEVAFDLETEMRRDDGSWLGIGWMEGIREQLPSPDAVGSPRGGGLLHYIHMEELLLACDQLRFRMIVHACQPGPCPPISADDGSGPGALVDDRSAR